MDPSEINTLLERKAAFERLLDSFEVWLLVFGILVVIGVAGESVYGFRTWWNNRKLRSVDQSIEQYRQGETARLNKQAGDANKEAGEARKDAAHAIERASKAEENLASANERAALAEQHAAEANRTAEGFRLDIARANERAAAANETAERERLARLQLEARLADRVLSPTQQQSIAADVRPLGTFSTQIFWYSDTTEVTRIANMIQSTLAQAGWTTAGAHAQGGITVSGIVVAVIRNAGTDLRNAADRLVSELVRNGVGATLTPTPLEEIPGPGMSFGNTIPNPQIRIMIGAK